MKDIDERELLHDFIEASEMPVLTLFHADWCAPCQRFKPQFKLSAHFNPEVVHVQSNIEKVGLEHDILNIKSVPTVILWKNGRPLKTIMGRTPHAIAKEIEDYV